MTKTITETRPSPTQQVAHTAENVQEDSKTVARLLGEVVADAQHLVRKEFELAKHEVLHEVDKAKQGAISLGIGAGVTAVGGVMLMTMLVHLLVDLFSMTLWQSYLLVGLTFITLGVILLVWGQSRLKNLSPVPEKAIDNVRKDAQWVQEQNPSSKK